MESRRLVFSVLFFELKTHFLLSMWSTRHFKVIEVYYNKLKTIKNGEREQWQRFLS